MKSLSMSIRYTYVLLLLGSLVTLGYHSKIDAAEAAKHRLPSRSSAASFPGYDQDRSIKRGMKRPRRCQWSTNGSFLSPYLQVLVRVSEVGVVKLRPLTNHLPKFIALGSIPLCH